MLCEETGTEASGVHAVALPEAEKRFVCVGVPASCRAALLRMEGLVMENGLVVVSYEVPCVVTRYK